MSKATKRIKEGFHNVELVPEGTTEERYIYDDGNYPIVDNSNPEVFEGVFDGISDGDIVSPEWRAQLPGNHSGYTLQRFKLLD